MKRFLSSTLIVPLLLILAILSGCKGDANQRKKKFLDIGNKAYNKGDYKAAAINFRRALQEDKLFAEAHYRLGLTQMKAGAYGDAVAELQRAFSLAPDNSDAGTKLAEIYMMAVAGDPQRAKSYITEIRDVTDRLLKKDPKSYDGLRLSAYLLTQDGKVDEAIARYQQANEVKPDDPKTVIPWAGMLIQNHREKEGEQLIIGLIAKNKDYAMAYDLLYALYFQQHRLEDQERILRAKVDTFPDHLDYRVQLAAHYFGNQRRPDMEKELSIVSNSGKDGEGHRLVGDFFMVLREFDRAQKEYEAGIQQGGKNKAAFQMRMVELNAEQQKFDAANSMVDELVKADPKNSDAIAMRASLQVNSGDPAKIDSAISDLKSLVQRNPGNFAMHYWLARAYRAKAQKTNKTEPVELARLELDAAIKLRPDFAQAKIDLAELQMNKGEFGKAVVNMEEVLTANPANLRAQLIRAIAWAKQGEFAKARTALEGILKTSPMQQDARFALGEVYRMEGKYKEAEAVFREFRKISPGDPRAWSGIAQTMAAANRLKDAEAFLKEEVAADPKKEAARHMLADVYRVDSQFDAAIDQYKILLKEHPQNSDLHAAIAGTLRQKGDTQGAIDYYHKAIELNPNSPGAMTALAMVLESQDKVAESQALYEKILKIEPDNFIALNNLAFIKAEAGADLDGALTMANKARQQAPKVDVVADTLGTIYIKKNLSDDAIRIFNDLCSRDPDNAMFRYHLAQALVQKGDKVKAKQELEDVLRRTKSHPDVKYDKKIRELMPKLG